MGSGNSNQMVLSGSIEWTTSEFGSPIELQTGATGSFSYCAFSDTLTLSNNSSVLVEFSRFSTGSNACIVMNSSSDNSLSYSSLDSSNDPAINGSGAGSFIINSVSFLDNTNIAATLTLGTNTQLKSGQFQTANAAANLKIDQATISGEGSDANVDINLIPKGSGVVSAQSNLELPTEATQLQVKGGAVTDFIGSATLSDRDWETNLYLH